MKAKVYLGNNVEIMEKLPEKSVHAIVCDPDYGIASNVGKRGIKGDGHGWAGWEVAYNPKVYAEYAEAWTRAALRVAVPGAWLVMLGSPRTSHRTAAAAEDAGWEMRDTWIWHHNQGQMLGANNKAGGWSLKLRPVFDPIAVARKAVEGTLQANHKKWGTGMVNIDANREPSGKWPRNIFDVSKVLPGREVPDGAHHSTVKPIALMRKLVRLVTPPGGIVLDPFAGSGTTLEAAILEGFDAIGIEIQPDFVDLCNKRVARAYAEVKKHGS